MNSFPIIQTHHTDAPSGALFSILIPSWNNLPYLQLCVNSILKNSKYTHQIIVHVNEGVDGTLDWIKNSGLAYTYSDRNAGVCHSLNAMAQLASCSYILYLNDDMYVAKNWDAYLYDAICKKGDAYFYYSGTMVEYEDSGNKAVLAPYDFGRNIEDFDEKSFSDFVESNHRSDWSGACWPPSIVHKDLWDQAGGYDIAYSPGFYSDPDFAMKLWKLGVRDFRGIGKSLVYHFKCKSTGRVIRNDGRKTFAAKWGFPSSFLYKEVLQMGRPVNENTVLKFPRGIKFWMAKIKAFWIANF